MDFNYVFSGHFTCGCTLHKKMRHFCDIGLHPLLDYNDLTLSLKSTRVTVEKKLESQQCCQEAGFLFCKFIFLHNSSYFVCWAPDDRYFSYPAKILEKGCPTWPDNRGCTVFH